MTRICVFVLIIFAFTGATNFSQSCYEATPVFGSQSQATFVSDLRIISNSKDFDTSFKVTQINMCGNFKAFEGVQLFLSSNTSIMFLNPIGRTSSCDNFVIPTNQWIKQIQLAYNTQGVTFLKVVTDQGGSFSRGTFSQNDSSFTQLFTQDKPLIGMIGYQSTVVKSLGFLAFKCLNGQSNPGDSISQNSSITTPTSSQTNSSTAAQQQLQEQSDSTTPVGAIVAGILIPTFIIAGVLVSIVIYRRRIGQRNKIQLSESGKVQVDSEKQDIQNQQTGFEPLNTAASDTNQLINGGVIIQNQEFESVESDRKLIQTQPQIQPNIIKLNLLDGNDQRATDDVRLREQQLLKGKSVAERKKLLREIENHQQSELLSKFQMERQQLRHDEVMARRAIEERDRIDNMFKSIYGEEKQQLGVVHNPSPQLQLPKSTSVQITQEFEQDQKQEPQEKDIQSEQKL